MRIAINQPYFFPYLGYFSLIKHTDLFLFIDIVPFIHQSWIRRNRILSKNRSWQYILVPVLKSHRGTLIKDILICNKNNWKQMILYQLQYYKKSAPYYSQVIKLLNYLFESEFTDMVSLDKKSVEIVCDYLEIDYHIKVVSEMNLNIDKPQAPDEWALNICKVIDDVEEYWNLPGGTFFYDRTKYENAGFQIKFLRNYLKPYNQEAIIFNPGLSIIDVMMFNNKKEIHEMIDHYEFI